MLTNKGKYGIKALVYLARLPAGTTAQGTDIAEANRIPKKFLDAILLELRKSGVVSSKKGPRGGYALGQPAYAIRLGDVVRTLDGPLAPIACASRTAFKACDDCTDVYTCGVRAVMLEVRDAIAGVLDKTTLADLRDGKGSAIDNLMYHI